MDVLIFNVIDGLLWGVLEDCQVRGVLPLLPVGLVTLLWLPYGETSVCARPGLLHSWYVVLGRLLVRHNSLLR